MTTDHVDEVEGVDASVQLVDGRVSMSGAVTSGLHVEQPEQPPLSARESAVTLRLVDGVERGDPEPTTRVVLDLDGVALDALVDALDSIQQRRREGDR
jgi:hypothetical protein